MEIQPQSQCGWLREGPHIANWFLIHPECKWFWKFQTLGFYRELWVFPVQIFQSIRWDGSHEWNAGYIKCSNLEEQWESLELWNLRRSFGAPQVWDTADWYPTDFLHPIDNGVYPKMVLLNGKMIINHHKCWIFSYPLVNEHNYRTSPFSIAM